ncbi:thioredoxin domain-containing protein [Vibrio sp. WXL210]|uniref:thioredoxin domain-containing protein n=1 Tax=Vibrio sp. WXL210 TaxID=3450709 RepID=UPI003EC6670F
MNMSIKTPKFYLVSLLAIVLTLVGCSEEPTVPTEGEQYQRLNVVLDDMAPVTKIFSLTCGHCRAMQGYLPQLEQATGQSIDKVHVTFNESAQIAALIYYTAVMQSDTPLSFDTMEQLYSAIQMADVTAEEQKQAVELVFSQHGWASPYDIDEQLNSQRLELFQHADDVSIKARINAVPTFIVNGQYQVNSSAHEDVQDIANTINYLLNME